VSSQESAILHPPSIVVDANQVEAGKKKMTSQFSQGHALIVAVANYPKLSKLSQTVLKDATDVADLLISGDYCGYPSGNVRLLLDQNATAANIRREFAKLAKAADKNDTVVLFFSGHGGRVEGGKNAGSYLLPFDCDSSRLSETAIESSELTKLLSGIECERLVVLLDACHSGGVGELKAIAPVPEIKAGLDTPTYDALARGVGRVIMASSRVDEVSLVLRGMENSLFTNYLIEGLKGASPTRGDGFVHVFDLFRYVSEEVPKRASQHPIFKAHNVENDFAIALHLGGSKEPVHMRAFTGRQDRLNPKTKLAIINRLLDSWRDLAMYFDIPPKDIAKFPQGAEPQKILEWIEARQRTAELRKALNDIGRDDLVQELDQGAL
jgi:hypothetical protein